MSLISLSFVLSLPPYLSVCLVSPRSSPLGFSVSVSLGFSLSLSPRGARSVRQRRSVSLALALLVSLSPSDPVSASFVRVRFPRTLRPHSGRARWCLPRGRAHLVFSESGFCSQTNESGSKCTEPEGPGSGATQTTPGEALAGAGSARGGSAGPGSLKAEPGPPPRPPPTAGCAGCANGWPATGGLDPRAPTGGSAVGRRVPRPGLPR